MQTNFLPLRDIVIFPHMVVPLFVGRKKSIEALQRSMDSDKRIFLVTQKDPSHESPKFQDLYSIGTVAEILQLVKLPDGTVKVLVEGIARARLTDMDDSINYVAHIENINIEFEQDNKKKKHLYVHCSDPSNNILN